MSDCIFCKIIAGEIPSAKVYEDQDVYAFLDITQVTPGHTLVIPKQHVTDLFEYDAALAARTMSKLPKIARAIKRAFPEVKGLNLVNNNGATAYQSVFHSHFHLIPRYQVEEGFAMRFDNHMDTYTPEEFQARATQIAQQLEQEEDNE